MTAKTLPLPQQVCFALYSANNAMMRLYRPLLQPFDLTYPQYVVLLALWQQDNISLGQTLGDVYPDNANGGKSVLKFMIYEEKKKLDPEMWLLKK
jgi:hypothetical protein